MIVAVSAEGPGLDAACSRNFGRCAVLSFVDLDTLACESVPNAAAAAAGGAGIQAAQAVPERRADALVSANVGPNAMAVLKAAGIAVYSAPEGTVREAIVALREGRLARCAASTTDHFGLGAAAVASDAGDELVRLRERVAMLRRGLADLLDRMDTLSKGARTMRIAISVDDDNGLSSVCSPHFGRCPFFALVDVEGLDVRALQIVPNPFYPNHEPGQVPGFIHSQGAQVMLTGGMGGRAIALFQQYGIEPVTGAAGTVRHVLEAYLGGSLSGAESCRESVAHGHAVEAPGGERPEVERLREEARLLRESLDEAERRLSNLSRG